MNQVAEIEHKAIIEEISGNTVSLTFTAHSACSACHAKSACSLGNSEVKKINLPLPSFEVNTGETVEVLLSQNAGFRAVFLGYVLPFIVVLLSLLTFNTLGFDELRSGLFSLLLIVPYFLILFLLRKRINKSFSFRIRKISE